MKKGKFIVISGPSGVGKDTIVNKLISDKDYYYSEMMSCYKINKIKTIEDL